MDVTLSAPHVDRTDPDAASTSQSVSGPSVSPEIEPYNQNYRNGVFTRVLDAGWGTRRHTHAATIQLPRKIPVKLEPKSYFAVERTFLSWAGMAITLAATSSLLTTLAVTGDTHLHDHGLISRSTITSISLFLSPLAFLILAYALFMYLFRSHCMRAKEVGFYDDRVGPVVLAALIALLLCSLTIVVYASVLSR